MNKQSYSAPVFAVWEITDACNLKCPHCRASAHMNCFNEGSESVENRIIEEIIENAILAVNISGGEPLIHPRIFAILRKLVQNKISVGISTNALLLEERIDHLKQIGIDYIQVSLDAPKKIMNEFRGSPIAYDKAFAGIELSKKYGFFTQMNVAITNHNIDYLEEVIHIARELNPDLLFFRRFIPTGRGAYNSNLIPDKEKYLKVVKKLVDYKNNSKELFGITIDDPIAAIYDNKDISKIGCGAGITTIGINKDGEVYPCIFMRECIGDIKKISLREIWNNNKLLKNMRLQNINECAQCNFVKQCGGCRAYSGALEKDSLCPL